MHEMEQYSVKYSMIDVSRRCNNTQILEDKIGQLVPCGEKDCSILCLLFMKLTLCT